MTLIDFSYKRLWSISKTWNLQNERQVHILNLLTPEILSDFPAG